MTRNTTRRVEVAAPIYAPELKERIREMFRIQMADNVKARVQMSDGTYQKRTVGEDVPLNAQEYFFAKAYEAASVPLPAPIQAPPKKELPKEEPPKEKPVKEEPSQAVPEKEPTKEAPPVNPTQPAQ
jgi:polyphosphate kinase